MRGGFLFAFISIYTHIFECILRLTHLFLTLGSTYLTIENVGVGTAIEFLIFDFLRAIISIGFPF